MLAPFLYLSLFTVSAQASLVLHGVLEHSRAIWSLAESHRFKRQIGSDSARQCAASCAQDFISTIRSLGMDESSTGFFNNRLYNPETFNSFCEGVAQWDFCSGACSHSQTKKASQMFASLCGENRKTFDSHQACYAESDPQQNRVCDPKCRGQEEVKEEMNKLKSAAGDSDEMSRIINRVCEVTSCQIDCRIPIIYTDCQDKEAALFIGRWAQKSMKQALEPLAGRGLDIQCDDVFNFDPDKFNFDEPGVKIQLASVYPQDTYGKSYNSDNVASSTGNLASSTGNNLFMIVVSTVFAGLFYLKGYKI